MLLSFNKKLEATKKKKKSEERKEKAMKKYGSMPRKLQYAVKGKDC